MGRFLNRVRNSYAPRCSAFAGRVVTPQLASYCTSEIIKTGCFGGMPRCVTPAEVWLPGCYRNGQHAQNQHADAGHKQAMITVLNLGHSCASPLTQHSAPFSGDGCVSDLTANVPAGSISFFSSVMPPAWSRETLLRSYIPVGLEARHSRKDACWESKKRVDGTVWIPLFGKVICGPPIKTGRQGCSNGEPLLRGPGRARHVFWPLP